MTIEQYLTDCAAEECMEVAHRLIKANRFGMEQVQPLAHSEPGVADVSSNPEGLTNRERIEREFVSLFAVMDLLGINPGFMVAPMASDVQRAIVAKKLKVQRYIDISQGYGTLDKKEQL